MSHLTSYISHITKHKHMSHVTCHVSNVLFQMSQFFFPWTKWWSFSVGPSLIVFPKTANNRFPRLHKAHVIWYIINFYFLYWLTWLSLVLPLYKIQYDFNILVLSRTGGQWPNNSDPYITRYHWLFTTSPLLKILEQCLVLEHYRQRTGGKFLPCT